MTDWIDEAVEKRKLLKNNCSELFQQVAAILFKHDPMRLDYEVNTDEYEPEAGTIITRLADCSSYLDARKMIHEEFLRWFYDDVGDEDEYTEIAKEIWGAWAAFGKKSLNCKYL
jgi:hypothetical protein